METKKLEKCEYVMFPRLQEQGVEPKHVEREAFKAELRHVEGHGDFWLLHQQAKPHVTVHIQLARDEAHFDNILGWFIGQQKLHEFVRDDLTFISAFAGVNRDEMPFRYLDNIKGRSSESHQACLNGRVVTELDAVKCIVYALSDSARRWHEYGREVMESNKI